MRFQAEADQTVHAARARLCQGLCGPRGEGSRGTVPPGRGAGQPGSGLDGSGSPPTAQALEEGDVGSSLAPWAGWPLTPLGGGRCPDLLRSPRLGLAAMLEPGQSGGSWDVLS